jgi:hypothetical protein
VIFTTYIYNIQLNHSHKVVYIKPSMLNEWPYQKMFLASYIALYQAMYGWWVTHQKNSGFIHRTLSSQVWSMSDLTKRRFWLHTSHSIKPSMVDEWPHHKTILASYLTLHEANFFCYDVGMKKYSKFKNFHNLYIFYTTFFQKFSLLIYIL